MQAWIVLIAQFKVTKEENTIIAVFPIELDIDLSIITNNVFVNSTNIYGKANKNVLKIYLLNLCFIFYPLTYFYKFFNYFFVIFNWFFYVINLPFNIDFYIQCIFLLIRYEFHYQLFHDYLKQICNLNQLLYLIYVPQLLLCNS